jgi:5-methylcytosine-specific restriction enzyme A
LNIEQANEAALVLSNHYGVGIGASLHQDNTGQTIEFRPTDLDRNEGFAIAVRLGWRNIEAIYLPGTYSAPLISAMGQAADECKTAFSELAQAAIEEGVKIRMSINAAEVSPVEPKSWPTQWNSLSLSLKRSPIEWSSNEIEHVLKWGGRLLAIVLSVAPSEELKDTSDVQVSGLPEGARTTVEVNRYERSRINRAICIELRGTTCVVCDFDFGRAYGSLGEGYIHVHHIVPVSQLGGSYRINPAKDLVPICPNCHAMVHLGDPPVAIDDLRKFVRSMRCSRSADRNVINKASAPSE